MERQHNLKFVPGERNSELAISILSCNGRTYLGCGSEIAEDGALFDNTFGRLYDYVDAWAHYNMICREDEKDIIQRLDQIRANYAESSDVIIGAHSLDGNVDSASVEKKLAEIASRKGMGGKSRGLGLTTDN